MTPAKQVRELLRQEPGLSFQEAHDQTGISNSEYYRIRKSELPGLDKRKNNGGPLVLHQVSLEKEESVRNPARTPRFHGGKSSSDRESPKVEAPTYGGKSRGFNPWTLLIFPGIVLVSFVSISLTGAGLIKTGIDPVACACIASMIVMTVVLANGLGVQFPRDKALWLCIGIIASVVSAAFAFANAESIRQVSNAELIGSREALKSRQAHNAGLQSKGFDPSGMSTKELQQSLGVKADGVFGSGSARALDTRLKADADAAETSQQHLEALHMQTAQASRNLLSHEVWGRVIILLLLILIELVTAMLPRCAARAGEGTSYTFIGAVMLCAAASGIYILAINQSIQWQWLKILI